MLAQRRFILDNDGGNIFGNLGKDVEAVVAGAIKECSPEVTTYMLCSAGGTCYYPTKVGCCTDQKLLAAHKQGIDPFGMLLRNIKASGRETFITYRMNDVHNPTDENQWNTPRVRREHPDCIVGREEVAVGKACWMSYCLDYSRPEVQRYVLNIIAEQIELYGNVIDGFQLDWMRFPRHLSGTPEQVWDKQNIITELMLQLRKTISRSGRKILLSARVPTNPAGCRRLGFDLAEWGQRELIDLLILCPFLTTEWRVPVNEMRSLLNNASIPVYAGFDFGFGPQVHFPESLRGICSSLYDCGADGIYVFNFPCWIEYLAARPYHWLHGLGNPATAATKPLLLAVEHAKNRVTGVDQPAQLPKGIEPGKSAEFSIHIPLVALPAWRCMILARSGGNIDLTLNGRALTEQRYQSDWIGLYRNVMFLEYAMPPQYARPAQAEEGRIFGADPSALQAGNNLITITNTTERALIIEAINMALW
jgi:hypothetical protein